jgi:hypothetical protein
MNVYCSTCAEGMAPPAHWHHRGLLDGMAVLYTLCIPSSTVRQVRIGCIDLRSDTHPPTKLSS